MWMAAGRSCALLFLLACANVLAQSADIPPALWDRPRTGLSVLEQESVRRAVLAALAKPDSQIIVHHTPGPEPLVQAEELRSWLIALAIDARRVVLRSGVASGAPIKIEVAP
jgi:hypothetical protein